MPGKKHQLGKSLDIGRIAMRKPVVKACNLYMELHQMFAGGNGDSPAADKLRDDIEDLYRSLTESEREFAGHVSGDLYMLQDEDMYSAFNGNKVARFSAIQELVIREKWEEVLKELRVFLDLPRVTIARYRGLAYSALGLKLIGNEFWRKADKL